VDSRLWEKLKGRLAPPRSHKRQPWANERLRSFASAALIAAVVLFAIDESVSKPSAIGRPHATHSTVAHSDLDFADAPATAAHATFHMPTGTLTEYLSDFAEIGQVD